MSGNANSQALLAGILKRLASPSSTSTSSSELSPAEVALLARSLLPTATRDARSLSYLILSKFCEIANAVASRVDENDTVYATFRPYVENTFVPLSLNDNDNGHQTNSGQEENEAEPESCLPLTYLFSALFPLLPKQTVRLLTEPIPSIGDPLGIILEVAELPSPLQPALAEMLASAAGTKPGREMVRSRALEWLRGAIDQKPDGGGDGEDQGLGVLCAVALSKLAREEDSLQAQAQAQGQSQQPRGPALEDMGFDDVILCRKMMDHIESLSCSTSSISSTSTQVLTSTVEGLGVLSLRPRNKVILASSPSFLKGLISLSPTQGPKPGSLPVTPRGSMDLTPSLQSDVDIGLCYGLATILVNLTSPKPILSAEDQQIAKLRAMALSANKNKLTENNDEDEIFDSEEDVRKRTKAVLRTGVVPALSGLGRADSKLVKEGLGRLCRNLVEDQGDRLGFVRDGGFKVLSTVVRDLLAATTSRTGNSKTKLKMPSTLSGPTISTTGDADVLPAFQALAKLVITTPPHLLFPPPYQTTSLNALTPLYHLLIHPFSLSIQRFEGLMALTNLASVDPSIASKIVLASLTPLKVESGWRGSGRDDNIRVILKVEELLLDENELVRRAATQLICNLISSQAGYEYFAGELPGAENTVPTLTTATEARVKSRLNILLVLAGVDDLPTRLAAGGGLAIVTESSNACAALLSTSDSSSGGDGQTQEQKTVWTRVLRMLEPDQEEDFDLDEDGEPIPVISSSTASTDSPDPGMVHRGVIILLNLVTYTLALTGEDGKARENGLKDIRQSGLEGKLMHLLRMKELSGSDEILQPTVECLKMLKRAGQ
ncbi:hypothetical protein I316_07131 [Kwoniella heveanensis BCC8398]|uniref:UNC-45/Cro1/She4 central domain-containing protein n=1 Tax=Kwoniella heveanensis BCC8398 TaxID=1296120 RepID=A0A1B9GJ94_9TREE|nr:hypothetical protein I316_07131 [Kwoniella heveanensis BCC8398]